VTSLPTVSVVLPTRNGIHYLDQAVGSVLDQTFEDWELILVDDASEPPTATRVDHWSRVDPRIRAVHLPVRRHLPGALNCGFDHASGRYWGWISDDNRYRPAALERFVDVLDTHSRVDVVYSGYTVIDHDGREIGVSAARPPEDLPTRNVVGPSFLFRPGVFAELGGYDESMRLAEDYDLWLRAAARFVFQPADIDLYEYRRHSASLTSTNAGGLFPQQEKAVVRHVLDSPQYGPDAKARACVGLAIAAGRRRLLIRAAHWLVWASRYSTARTSTEFGRRLLDRLRRACRRGRIGPATVTGSAPTRPGVQATTRA